MPTFIIHNFTLVLRSLLDGLHYRSVYRVIIASVLLLILSLSLTHLHILLLLLL